MTKPVNLLVCLNPLPQENQISELDFFVLVNPIAPVTNLKLISREGQLKALVQVQDEQFAQMVIGQLHRRSVKWGRVKVFYSHLKCVYYNQSIGEIMMSVGSKAENEYRKKTIRIQNSKVQEESGRSSSQELAQPPLNKFKYKDINARDQVPRSLLFSESEQQQEPHGSKVNSVLEVSENSRAFKLTIFTGKAAVELTHSNLPNVVKVRHDDPEALKQNKIIRMFRRFGRISDIAFDPERVFWAIEYRSDREVSKVVNAINSEKLYGYKLLGDYPPQQELPDAKSINHVAQVSKLTNSGSNRPMRASASRVCAFFANESIRIEKLCVFISQVCIPTGIEQCIDPKSGKFCFLVEFEFVFQAAKMLSVLSQQIGEFECSRVLFA